MNTYEMKTNETEVTIYRISEDGHVRVKEKIARIDLQTGELMPIGRMKISGAEPRKTSMLESKLTIKVVILLLILLVVAIGFFAFFCAGQQKDQADFYFFLGFASLVSVVVSIVFYIKWLTNKTFTNVSDESDTIDGLESQNSSEPYENPGKEDEFVQKILVTSENDSYFLLLGGEAKGPFTYEQLKKSEIPNNIQVTTETLNDWFPASQFELLASVAFEPKDPSLPIEMKDFRIDDDGSIKYVNK